MSDEKLYENDNTAPEESYEAVTEENNAADDDEGYDTDESDAPAELEITDEAAGSNEDEASPVPAPAKTRLRIQTPVIIAAAILLVTVLCFGCWGLFFNNPIYGDWTLKFKVSDTDYSVTFGLEKDGTCYFHNGGVIYKGTYTTGTAENGRNTLHMRYTSFGQEIINSNFYYDLTGNSVAGRKLVLTDLNGLIFSPEKISEESGTESKPTYDADNIIEDGTRYYVYTLDYDGAYETKRVSLDGAIDDKLTGIWLETNADSNYDNTFAFYEDGTYQITYRDLIYKGCYAAKDGVCVFNICQVDGTESKNSLDYSFNEDKLTITVNDVPATFVRTDNEYAFDTGIK